MAAAARTPKYMYKTAPGNSGELSIEYGTDLGALTRLEVSEVLPELSLTQRSSCCRPPRSPSLVRAPRYPFGCPLGGAK